MSRTFGPAVMALSVIALDLFGLASARARPPNITPSPGYDRRLQESREALAPPPVQQPPAPVPHPKTARRHTSDAGH